MLYCPHDAINARTGDRRSIIISVAMEKIARRLKVRTGSVMERPRHLSPYEGDTVNAFLKISDIAAVWDDKGWKYVNVKSQWVSERARVHSSSIFCATLIKDKFLYTPPLAASECRVTEWINRSIFFSGS